jgi:hypothetical protein
MLTASPIPRFRFAPETTEYSPDDARLQAVLTGLDSVRGSANI